MQRAISKSVSLLWVRCLWLGALMMAAWPAAMAQVAGAPFNCDVVFYQMRNAQTGTASQLVRFATVNATVTPTGVYSALQTREINSIGYNPVDNYIYGIEAATQIPALYRIGATGYELVGNINNPLAGGTALAATFLPTAGVFDAAGRFYFAGQGGGISPPAIFRVDVIPLTGAPQVSHQYNLTPTAVANFGDFDFNGAGGTNGLLLGTTGTNHYRITLQPSAIDPARGTATVVTVGLVAGANGNNVGGVGSAFYDAFTGRFFVFNNDNNDFWQIQNPEIGTPSPIFTDAAAYVGPPAFPGNYTPTDGTSCPISGTRIADLAITKTDGASSLPTGAVTSYTITVTNAGPYPANYAVVRDPPAPGLNKLSVTCSAPGGPPSAVCPATLSTSTFEDGIQVITFPPGTTLVFALNAQVTASPGTNVTNTATVVPAIDTVDLNLANNTAVDVNVINATTSTVVSAAAQCPAGTLEGTVNLLTNGNFAAAAPLLTEAATGLINTYNIANSISRQTGTQAYLPTSAILQNPFPGDPGRSVSGSESWLLSNGKNGAANYRVWTQPVTGLIVGRTYEFLSYVSNATRPGTSSPTIPILRLQVGTGAVTSTLATSAPVNETALGGDVWTIVQGTFSATATAATLTIANFALPSAEPGGGDVAGIAQATLRACSPAADVNVTKNNGTNTLISTGTTAYTITVSNPSGVTATNTLIVDPAVSNLAKTSVTCIVTGTANQCPAALSIVGFENSGLTIPRVASGGGTVVFVVQANVTGPPGSTATNIVTVSGIDYTDANPANNSAQDSDPIFGRANLSISKINSTSSIISGSTTSYTVTVANAGPATVVDAVLTDPEATGLSCTGVTCTGVIGAATCPSAGSTTIAALQVGGIRLPSMVPPASVIFRVDCTVTAPGN